MALLFNQRWVFSSSDDGEANLSISSSRSVTYTYDITQQHDFLHRGAAEQKETGSSSSSSGLLTMSHRTMRLQILPPARGTYDVKVFARPELATTPLSWVCSFTVECAAPRAMEEIPENPFLSWGLQAGSAALGVAGSSQGSQVTEVEEGESELTLKTSRSLMALCELVHPGMEPAIAKRCVATQIQPDALTCHVLCPDRGFYRLSVFVRDYDKPEARFQNAANFLLHCKSTVASRSELFPPSLGSACGPGTRTLQAGLSKFSHAGALVSTQQGKCNVTFHKPAGPGAPCCAGEGGGEPGAGHPAGAPPLLHLHREQGDGERQPARGGRIPSGPLRQGRPPAPTSTPCATLC